MDSDTRRFSPPDEARVEGTPSSRLPAADLPGTTGNGAPPSYPSQNTAPRPVAPAFLGGNNWLAWVMIGLGLLFFFQPFSFGRIIGQAVVLVLGLIFLYVYSGPQRGNVGFLIPGGILTGLGTGILLQALTYESGWVPLGLGLGFCAIWFFQRAFWWALIPGGIISLAGLQALTRYGSLPGFNSLWRGDGESFWALLLVGLGIWLMMSRRRHVRH